MAYFENKVFKKIKQLCFQEASKEMTQMCSVQALHPAS
jgi:hypothetical protein